MDGRTNVGTKLLVLVQLQKNLLIQSTRNSSTNEMSDICVTIHNLMNSFLLIEVYWKRTLTKTVFLQLFRKIASFCCPLWIFTVELETTVKNYLHWTNWLQRKKQANSWKYSLLRIMCVYSIQKKKKKFLTFIRMFSFEAKQILPKKNMFDSAGIEIASAIVDYYHEKESLIHWTEILECEYEPTHTENECKFFFWVVLLLIDYHFRSTHL